MKQRVNRQGYSDTAPMSVFKTMDLDDFLKVDNPFPVFMEYSSIKLTEAQKKKYFQMIKPPEFLEDYFEDILVLGKNEIQAILKWRSKLKNAIRKQQQQQKEQKEEEEEEKKAEKEVKEEKELNELKVSRAEQKPEKGMEIEGAEEGQWEDEPEEAAEAGPHDKEAGSNEIATDSELEEEIRKEQKKQLKQQRKEKDKKILRLAKQ